MTTTQGSPNYVGDAAPQPESLQPVAPSERNDGLDVLRGWALFGVLWSNLNDWYYTTKAVTRTDHVFEFAQTWFIESRFYELLILLFGIGFAIQLTRAQQRATDLRDVYLRRSAALLGIGLVHAFFIWHGDILMSYALASFMLLLFRDASPRQQLAWGILLACAGGYIGNHIHFALGQVYRVPENWFGGSPVTYATGTLAQIQVQRFRDVWHWWGFFGMGYFGVVGKFLIGAWAYRSGLVERVIANRGTTLRFLAICVAVALVGFSMEIYHWDVKVWPRLMGGPPETLLAWSAWNPMNIVFTPFRQTAMACGLIYAALLLLLFQTQRGRRILAPLAATGRMALTTYLTQSLVCTTLFYSYGLGWFGKVGYTGMFGITVSLFAAQLLVSTWWLRRFRFGPVEWLLRTITYGRAPAMRVAA